MTRSKPRRKTNFHFFKVFFFLLLESDLSGGELVGVVLEALEADL